MSSIEHDSGVVGYRRKVSTRSRMYRKSRADIVIMLSTFLIVVVVVVCRRQSLRHPGGAEGAGGHGSLARHRRPARRRAQSRVDELGRRPQPVRRHRRLLLPRQPARHALAVGQPALQLHRVSVATTSRRPRDDPGSASSWRTAPAGAISESGKKIKWKRRV